MTRKIGSGETNMEAPVKEGTYKEEHGNWWKVEKDFYPRERFVLRRLSTTANGMRLADNRTPELTSQQWANLQSWL
ncbi:hypothetical protein bAD24_p00775 (plasmid) [Burkholderia sp. AD24]|nr:hypothetical protein bAD24_p00775 [Burkholderia sp. AD24]